MPDSDKTREQHPDAGPSLRQQAYEQEMNLLKLADKSKNKAIQRYALKAAKEERRHIHRQEARLTTPAVVAWCVFVWFVFVVVCWWAFVNYQSELALRVSGLVLLATITLTLIFLALGKHIDASIVVDFLRDVWKKFSSGKDDDSSKQKPHQA